MISALIVASWGVGFLLLTLSIVGLLPHDLVNSLTMLAWALPAGVGCGVALGELRGRFQ